MEERLMFVYRGEITNNNSVSLLTLLEKEMESADYSFIGRKRLFMFALENLQNVTRHGDHLHHADMSLVSYSKTDDGYTITTGNIIETAHINNLKGRLEQINNLNITEIKTFYREILKSAEFSDKGGAGLGLIEMANKTGNKLDYDFITIDSEHSYFVLSKTVNSEGVGVHSEGKEKPFNTRAVTQLEHLMAENKVYLTWSGHISSGVGGEVLSFAETKLSEEDVSTDLRRRVFSILVEILENVAKYSPGHEPEERIGMPVVIIRLENEDFVLTSGNLILNSQVNDLREKLDTINGYEKKGLKKLFYKSLSKQTIETDSTGNMGLIDIARKSGGKLNYQFELVDELYSYYILTVRVEE